MIRRGLIVTAIAVLGAACELGGEAANDGERDVDDITTPDGGSSSDTDDDPDDASTGTDPDDDGKPSEPGMEGADAGMDVDPPGDGDGDSGTDEETSDAGAEPDPSQDAGADDPSDASTEDPPLPALAALYTFDENTGSEAGDSAGGFADALLNGAASWTTGVTGSALDLPGGASQSYVSLPANLLDSCDDITVALWMKLGSVTFWSRLLDIDGGVDGFLYFTPAQDVGGAPHLYFDIYHPPGAGAPDQGVSAAYPQGTTLVDEWHHVAFTLSGGTGRLYFDGVQIGSNAMTTKPSDLTVGENSHAWIGRSMFPDPYLEAAIDDLRVSCTAYTAEQVAELAQ